MLWNSLEKHLNQWEYANWLHIAEFSCKGPSVNVLLAKIYVIWYEVFFWSTTAFELKNSCKVKCSCSFNMFPPLSHWGQTQKQLLHFNRLRFLASFTLAGSSELMSISCSSDQLDGNPVQWEIFSWLFTRHWHSLTKDIWKYLQRCIIRSVALGCSGKYSRHNVMTEKKEKKQLDERSQKNGRRVHQNQLT